MHVSQTYVILNFAGRFTDLKDGKVDFEAEELRERLKITRVQPLLGPAQLKKYHLNWTPTGIDETDEQHKNYIDNLIEDIIQKLKEQVERCLKDDHNRTPLYKEVLHHLHFCMKETQLHASNHDMLDNVRERMLLVYDAEGSLVFDPLNESPSNDTLESSLLDVEEHPCREKSAEMKAEYEKIQESLNRFDCKFIHSGFFDKLDTDPDVDLREEYTRLPNFKNFSRPVVLFGCSGSGKTAMMAQIARETPNWFPNSVSVIRFLGTSLLSFSIKDVLVSICAQIISIYKVNIPSYIDMEKDYMFLVQFFHSLLWKIDSRSRPLVIILDSIDQLNDANNAHVMNWLPMKLPLNVHLVISLIPSIHCCLENILSIMPCTEQYLEIPAMSSETANDMISIYLRAKNRRITKTQRRFVLEKFHQCPQPLYLRVLLDQAVTWRSTTLTSELAVGDDITTAINKYFSNLEKKHGEVTVKNMMGKN